MSGYFHFALYYIKQNNGVISTTLLNYGSYKKMSKFMKQEAIDSMTIESHFLLYFTKQELNIFTFVHLLSLQSSTSIP